MLFLRSFSFVAIALSFGVIGLGASPAEAAICCSASVCQREIPPSYCDKCSPSCVADEQSPATGEIVYDEVESLCYIAGDFGPAASQDAGCE